MKKIIILTGVLALLGGSIGYYYYNKPRSGAAGFKPAYTLEAGNLFAEYMADETAANTKYLGKVIQVSGIVKSTGIDDRGTMNIILDAGNELGAVTCQVEKQDRMPEVKNGSPVAVKGFCSGLLMDVVLVDCEIVKNN